MFIEALIAGPRGCGVPVPATTGIAYPHPSPPFVGNQTRPSGCKSLILLRFHIDDLDA